MHSQVRRGIAEGLWRDELRPVAFLAMTTLGFPKAVAALTWIEDIVEEGGSPSRMTRVPRDPVEATAEPIMASWRAACTSLGSRPGGHGCGGSEPANHRLP